MLLADMGKRGCGGMERAICQRAVARRRTRIGLGHKRRVQVCRGVPESQNISIYITIAINLTKQGR